MAGFMDKLKSWFGQAKEKAEPMAKKAGEAADKAWDKTKDVAGDAWDKTKDVAGDIKDRFDGDEDEEKPEEG